MQVVQGVGRNARQTERHRRADPGIEHPLGKRRDDSRFDLEVNDASACPLLSIVSSDTPAMERMPAVVDLNVVPDMGRMTA
jgi:hypothetical protein